jgi:site-specific recombinase XerD
VAAARGRGPTDLAECATGFLTKYLVDERGCSRLTVGSYARALAGLFGHVSAERGVPVDRLSLRDLTAEGVRSYLDSVELSGCCASTRNLRLAAAKSFSRYALRDHPAFMLEGERILAIGAKRVPKGQPDYLEAEAMRALLAAPDQTTTGRREAALMSTLYDTGARVSELLGLELRDLRLGGGDCAARLLGKGGKVRTVPITTATAGLVLAHIADRGIDRRDQPSLSAAAFCHPGRSRYTRPGVAKMISRNLQRAREAHSEIPFPESSHPHAFRASRAIHLLDSGVDVIRVRDFLGHVSVQTTEIYLRVTTEQTREAVRAAYPALVEASDPELRKDKDLMEFLRDMCGSQ